MKWLCLYVLYTQLTQRGMTWCFTVLLLRDEVVWIFRFPSVKENKLVLMTFNNTLKYLIYILNSCLFFLSPAGYKFRCVSKRLPSFFRMNDVWFCADKISLLGLKLIIFSNLWLFSFFPILSSCTKVLDGWLNWWLVCPPCRKTAMLATLCGPAECTL